jgi:capsular polysaccharide biosynthesis protein
MTNRIAFSTARLRAESVARVVRDRAPRKLDLDYWAPRLFQDLLYLPDLRLQVIENEVVPLEILPHAWLLDFERARNFGGRAPVEGAELEADRWEGGEVCILANLYSRNFYHWMTEELPRVVALESQKFKCAYVLPNAGAFAVESLIALGVDRRRLFPAPERPTIFPSAVILPAYHGDIIVRNQDLFWTVRGRLCGLAEARGERRLWSSRKAGVNNQGRDIVCADAVWRLLGRHGFEEIDFGALSFVDQISAARSAQILGGVHGAGFVHASLMPERGGVIECFGPNHINPGCLQICRQLGHNYRMLVHGRTEFWPYPHGEAVAIDLDQLELALASL